MTPLKHREEWQLAGLYRVDAKDIDRPLALRDLLVPGIIELSDDQLFWDSLDQKCPSKEVRPATGLLEQFVQLSEATGEQILAFARKWGVLNICEHGLPATHNPTQWGGGKQKIGCRPLGFDDEDKNREMHYLGREPISAWRQFSRQARALLNVAAQLHHRELGRAADWKTVYEASGREAPWWQRASDVEGIAVERNVLARVLNEWLLMANARPQMYWFSSANPQIHLSTGDSNASLFTVIACQLVFSVSRIDGLEVCSGCGVPFLPTRRPRKRQRRYCAACRRDGVPLRHAQRDSRRRRRQAARNTRSKN